MYSGQYVGIEHGMKSINMGRIKTMDNKLIIVASMITNWFLIFSGVAYIEFFIVPTHISMRNAGFKWLSTL